MSEVTKTGVSIGDDRHPRRTEAPAKVLEIDNLIVEHRNRSTGDVFRAVDQVSLTVCAGQSVAIVGESGSGKTTLAMAATGLGPRGDSQIKLLGNSLNSLSSRRMRELRPEVQVVFQDPHGSLDPRQSVRSGLKELRTLQKQRTSWIDDKGLLAQVRLDESILDRYPHQLSGGQAQRVCIARALLMRPRLIVADEPTSGLDVSVQTDVLKLLEKAKEASGAALLMISHDLAVVRNICDSVHVMFRGQVVEAGLCETVFMNPQNDYTRELLAAMPGGRWRSRQ